SGGARVWPPRRGYRPPRCAQEPSSNFLQCFGPPERDSRDPRDDEEDEDRDRGSEPVLRSRAGLERDLVRVADEDVRRPGDGLLDLIWAAARQEVDVVEVV